jgi:DNA-binding transcriptional LysR family regulator
MTMDQLQQFLSIERLKSFSDASYEMNISQSNLSKRIQALENELGVKLFRRNARNITLTDSGLLVYAFAQQTVKYYLEMSEQLKYNSNFENKCISCSKKEYGFQL